MHKHCRLVVGSGGSGVQIAEDLLSAGRTTWLCVGNFKRVPRSYRDRDIMDWFEELNLTSQPAVERNPSDHSPLLTGVDGGYEVDLRRVVAQGGTLLGRLENVKDDVLVPGDTPQEPALRPRAPGPMPAQPPSTLDLTENGIASVIWATGYGVDFSWIDCGDYLADGMPVQEHGISQVPGLYFLGLPFLHSIRSSFFWGVGDDAEHVVAHLSGRQ